ncbi:MAG: tRNA (guanosine(37)-N1)-methyltransferase TrmD [Pseudomonadota bacterium]|nr:tRNA (guanosine(37)-N1)-methyltransferase TrmD [Pseudomonadota bacterium]
MNFQIVTIFPSLIKDMLSYGIIGKALKSNLIKVNTLNPRDFSDEDNQRIDDKPYGGGPGMVMQAQPLIKAISYAQQQHDSSCVVYMSPRGSNFNQNKAKEFSKKRNLIIVCGRYEGIDQRVLDNKVDEECSVGDFVVTGGEIPALLVTEAVSRFIPGVVGDSQSVDDDSFSQGLLEYPQFTRPEKDESGEVPQVLLSGDHKKISKWRLKQSILKTYKNRPDLLNSRDMTEEENIWLKEIINEEGK